MPPELLDSVLLQTDIAELELYASGKVRDVYRVDNERYVRGHPTASPAFDYVLDPAFHKRESANSAFFVLFDLLRDIVPIIDHRGCRPLSGESAAARRSNRGRSMLVTRADMVAIECVVGIYFRLRLKEYQASGRFVVSHCRKDCANRTSFRNPSHSRHQGRHWS